MWPVFETAGLRNVVTTGQLAVGPVTISMVGAQYGFWYCTAESSDGVIKFGKLLHHSQRSSTRQQSLPEVGETLGLRSL